LSYDLRKGYLQIFRVSLRVDGNATAGGAAGERGAATGAAEAEAGEEKTATAMLTEYARMQLKILPKKGDLRDLNNWRGAMLLDAVPRPYR
jgi:hypothetical protein